MAYQFFTFILYMLELKRLGRNNLHHMFSQDKMLQEVWIKDLCTRDSLEAFLRQLHFENSADPWGRKFPHSTNYRPNGVPKVRHMYDVLVCVSFTMIIHIRRWVCYWNTSVGGAFFSALRNGVRMTRQLLSTGDV